MIDLAPFIPTHMRNLVAEGEPPLYNLNRPAFDKLPIDTFVVHTEIGTAGQVPEYVGRIVKPNAPGRYASRYLTPGRRLIYVCWHSGRAIKHLLSLSPGPHIYRHIVQPGDPRHDMIAAFKVACDTRRAWSGEAVAHKPDMLLRALAITP